MYQLDFLKVNDQQVFAELIHSMIFDDEDTFIIDLDTKCNGKIAKAKSNEISRLFTSKYIDSIQFFLQLTSAIVDNSKIIVDNIFRGEKVLFRQEFLATLESIQSFLDYYKDKYYTPFPMIDQILEIMRLTLAEMECQHMDIYKCADLVLCLHEFFYEILSIIKDDRNTIINRIGCETHD